MIFGYPGGSVLHIYHELAVSNIRHVLTRHEQGAAHAADGYARVSGEVGVCLATSGPGATNLVTGLATAYMDSIPMVAIAGQVGLGSLGRDAFQEADMTGITLSITKHSYLVRDASQIPRVIREAFEIAATGRPGPVLVVLPKDVTAEFARADIPGTAELPGYRPVVDGHPGQIEKLCAALKEAHSPLIYAGGGIVSAGAAVELRRLVDRCRLPVTTSLMGLGCVRHDHPLFLGMAGMHGTVAANYALEHCDLLVAIGTRFDDRVAMRPDRFAPRARIIHVDIDSAEIGKNVRVDIPIVGDCARILSAANKRQPAQTREQWLAELASVAESNPLTFLPSADNVKPQEIIRELGALAPDAVVVTDVGQHQMFCAQHFPFSRPRQLITSGGLGTMGYGLPAAIGACIAPGRHRVVLVTGEGGFQMNVQELATAVEARIDLAIVIVNNNCLGMVRQWQEMFHSRRYSAVLFERNPDFELLAHAYGAAGRTVDRPEELGTALRWAVETPGVNVVNVRVDPGENVYPIIPPGGTFSDTLTG